jgi:IS4 transposase
VFWVPLDAVKLMRSLFLSLPQQSSQNAIVYLGSRRRFALNAGGLAPPHFHLSMGEHHGQGESLKLFVPSV